ncbi:MAG: YkgJ family cysteine cluster protein [Bryobacterales bacterium]|nr:YkgJ family cysteine cluster protein [Bryobacterales bacterium]
MLTDLVQIRRLGEQKRPENERLRRHLKTHRYVERRLVQIAHDIQDRIDCAQCANCCRVATVQLIERDIPPLAKFLGISEARFKRDYTMPDDEGRLSLKWTEESGCVFLSGNDCSVYEVRPASCRNFPHLVKGEGPVSTRMWQFIDRACYCPIVYNALEAWKPEVGFKG